MTVSDLQQEIYELPSQKQLQLYRILKSKGVPFNKTDDGKLKFSFQPKHTVDIQNTITFLKKETDPCLYISKPSIQSTPHVETPIPEQDKISKKGKEKRVTIVEEDDADNEHQEGQQSVNIDIDELEKQMKQNVTLHSSQLRIRRKTKDLLKKIAKHKHACVEKSYGRELTDREDDSGASPEDDVIAIDENADSTGMMEDDDEIKSVEEMTEFAGENDDVDNLSAVMFEQTEDDDSKAADEIDVDTDTEEQTDDVSQDETEETMASFDQMDNLSDAANLDKDDESETEDATRFNFHDTSMRERYLVYKEILLNSKGMEFGCISEIVL